MRLGWIWLTLLGCGGSTAPIPAADGGPTASCSLPDGTYSESFTLATMGLGCASLDDVTFSVPYAAPGVANPYGQIEAADAGGTCSVTQDTSTCTTSTTCTSTVGGHQQIINVEISVHGDFANGTLTIQTDDPNSPPRCMWNTTATKG
jgi:hypothetical protein